MARDFSPAASRIATTLTTHYQAHTWVLWLRIGSSGTTGQRALTKSSTQLRYVAGTPATLLWQAKWTTTDGTWTVPAPAEGAWHHVAVAYDGAAATNDPDIYLDGILQTETETQTPAGSYVSDTVAYMIGAQSDGTARWRGVLAEIAVYDTKLTASEILALSRGIPPGRVRRARLQGWWPLYGQSPEPDLSGKANNGVVSNASVFAHAPVGPPASHPGMAQTTGSAVGQITVPVLDVTASVFGPTLTAEAVSVPPVVFPPTVVYEVMAVRRVPQTAGPPTLTPVGRIIWTGLSWTEELTRPGRVDVGCHPGTFTDPVRDALRARDPLEIGVWRDSDLVAQGPLLFAQLSGGEAGPTLSLYAAQSPLAYLWSWYEVLDSDLVFTAVDQTLIVRQLIDRWQARSYGHFGIDTSTIVASGVTRDRVYPASEIQIWGERVSELAAVERGFDLSLDLVSEDSRQLLAHHPRRGVDRSQTVILERGIVDPEVSMSWTPGDLAAECYGLGTSPDQAATRSVRTDTPALQRFGLLTYAATFDGTTVQASLDDSTQELLDRRRSPLFRASAGLMPMPEAGYDDFGVGDTVTFAGDLGLGDQAETLRVAARRVAVSVDGAELISVEPE